MTRKAKAKPEPSEPGERSLYAHEILMNHTVQSGLAMDAFGKFAGELDLTALLKRIREETVEVLDGNIRPIEGMLYGQALALETMFTCLSRRAMSQEYLNQFQSYMTLALKAQAQCRCTLEALAEVKNPRTAVAFVKQANISQGPQQVNNGPQSLAQGKSETVKNELLGDCRGDRLELGAQGASGGRNSTVETVGAVNGAAQS